MLTSWMSIDNSNRVFILGVLTAAAFAGAYIFWGPNPSVRPKRRKGRVPGLLNLGKTCFVNAVLQAIASSPVIVNWLEVLHAKLRLETGPENGLALIPALHSIVRVLNNKGPDVEAGYASAEEVLRALRRHHWVISNDEQDAHEMFHVLTSTIEEEMQDKASLPSLADATQLNPDEGSTGVPDCLSKCCTKLPKFVQKDPRRCIPYRGLLASQLRCRKCGHKSPIKFDSFDSLSLSIPSNARFHLNVEDCLRHFMMPEQVQDVECEKCSSRPPASSAEGSGGDDNGGDVKVKSASIKQLTIGKLPDVLCIHIQRMTWLNNGMPMKEYRHIAFPEHLDMSEFVYSPKSSGSSADRKQLKSGNGMLHLPLTTSYSQLDLNKNASACPSSSRSCSTANQYRLQTVIVHLGDVHSGHFVAYRRVPVRGGSRWFQCSDTSVQEVTQENVFKCDAYMLLYERHSAAPLVRTTKGSVPASLVSSLKQN